MNLRMLRFVTLAALAAVTAAPLASASPYPPPPGDPCSGALDTNCWYWQEVHPVGGMWVYCGLWVSGGCVYGAPIALLKHVVVTSADVQDPALLAVGAAD